MSNLIYQLNHLQNINSARYNQFSNLATDCLYVGGILVIIAFLVTLKSFATKYFVEYEHARIMMASALFILGIFTALASIPLNCVADEVKTSEINYKISKIKKEMSPAINNQATKYPYCVKINGDNGFNETIVFLPTKKDAINYIKANSNTKRIFAANYITLSENNDQLKKGSNTSLSMRVDQMQVDPTAPALHKLLTEPLENN